ncbi:MAG: AFG1 family ATPase [Betaproteobacteria bacterium]|nr:AFG1 family ATPase [Betaproteobacteria bacterium]
MDLLKAYRTEVARKSLLEDQMQLAAIERLQSLAQQLLAFDQARGSWLGRIFSLAQPPKGLWLWGGVGRGKTFLMDLFFDQLSVEKKARFHFHEFMREVHRELGLLKGEPNPLDAVGQQIANRYQILCFDEFHVSDIADAMILERLLQAVFAQGMVLVCTSNYRPAMLYPNGLHRDRILPAIALLEDKLESYELDAGMDYRRRALELLPAYLSPLGPETEHHMRESFERLADGPMLRPAEIEVAHRSLPCLGLGGGVIWLDFQALCGSPRSQIDYLELAERFHTVLLQSVPLMSAAMASEARRFVWLVDVFYDQSVKLIVSAEDQPEMLYRQGALSHEFARTASRLIEMQTKAYRGRARRQFIHGGLAAAQANAKIPHGS